MTLKEAQRLLGGVSRGNAKMNCPCYGLPVTTCTPHRPEQPNSTCNPKNCYAQRNCYNFPSVKNCLAWRLGMITDRDEHELLRAFIKVIGSKDHFRFFDSGDFPDFKTMKIILEACESNPQTKVWLPTKRYDLVRGLRQQSFETTTPSMTGEPANVCMRVGAWQIDPTDDTVDSYVESFGNIAIVVKERTRLYDHDAVVCRAPKEAQCITDCTACFDRTVPVVVYQWH